MNDSASSSSEKEQIGNGYEPIQLEPGTGSRCSSTGRATRFGVATTERGVNAPPDETTEIRLEPYPSGGIQSRDDPKAEIQFIPAGHRNAVAEVPSTLGLPDNVDHKAMQHDLLESAAVLAENGEHDQADRLAATAVGYYMEADRRD